MNEAEEFFYKHAGWSYDPAKETSEEGRVRTAKALAAAERERRARCAVVVWSVDPEPLDVAGDIEPTEAHIAMLECYDPGTDAMETVASIGNVDAGYGDPYRRVIAANLALEWLSGK